MVIFFVKKCVGYRQFFFSLRLCIIQYKIIQVSIATIE